MSFIRPSLVSATQPEALKMQYVRTVAAVSSVSSVSGAASSVDKELRVCNTIQQRKKKNKKKKPSYFSTFG